MIANGVPAEEQSFGDARVPPSGAHQIEDLRFSRGEIGRGRLTPLSRASRYAPARFVEKAVSPLATAGMAQLRLGAGGEPRRECTVQVGATDTLLLYTDGLIERRDENINTGLERLAAHALLLGQRSDLASALGLLVDAQRNDDNGDDVTAVAVRARRS